MSTLEIKNPGYISTLTKTAGVPGTKTVDETDFIHTGLIKTLALQARGNFAVANGASSADMGFKITQSDVGGKTKLTVTTGKIFRDGKYETVPAETFTANGTTSVQSPAVSLTSFDQPTSGVSYFLLVADTTPELQIRGDKTVTDRVPDYTAGDTIIALIKMDSGDASTIARYVQYLTTDKTQNSLSIGYENSNAYAEAASLTGSSDGLAVEGITTLKQASGSQSGQLRFMDNDNSHYSGFQAAATTTSNSVYTLPAAFPGSNKILQTTAAGVLSWEDNAALDIDGYSALGGTGLHQTQDHFVFSDNGTEKKITFSNLQDAIFADVSGDATIAAGGGLTIAANAVEGSMLNSNVAGTGLDYGSNQLSVDVSDFMTNGANNYVVTATGTDGMNAEANMQFTGSALSVTGSIAASTTVTGATNLIASTQFTRTPVGLGLTSAAIGSATPILPKSIQILEVLPAVDNFFALPDANALPAGTIITVKNLCTVDAKIIPTGANVIDGGEIPAAFPNGITCTKAAGGVPYFITLPALRAITVYSYTDGGCALNTPDLAIGFAGTPIFQGTSGWLIIGTF